MSSSKIKTKSTKQIRYGAVLSYITIFINIVTGFLLTPIILSKIGDSLYGLYTLAISLISIFILDFGLSAATAKFVAEYLAKDENDKIDKFVGLVHKIYLIIDVIIIVVLFTLYFFIDNIYIKLTPEELKMFKTIYIMIAVFNVLSFPFTTLNGILQAYEEFIKLKLLDLIFRVLVVVSTILSLALGFGLYGLILSNILSSLLIMGIKIIIVKKSTGISLDLKYKDKEMVKNIFSFSVWTTIALIAQRFIFNITPTILGVVSGSEDITIFGLSSQIKSF